MAATSLHAASTSTCFDTDTKLMLHMNGVDGSTTFTDSSTAAKTVTANGNAQIDTAQSKFGGASGLFDGSGDFLTVPDSTDWDLGTGDFTIDFWIRFNATGSTVDFISRQDTQFRLGVTNSGDVYWFIEGNERWTRTAAGFSTGVWYHLTFTRSGTTVRVFKDGTALGSTGTSSDNIAATGDLYIAGNSGGGLNVNGWIEELRWVKGTAIWTSNFTPPSAEYTSCGGGASRRVISWCSQNRED